LGQLDDDEAHPGSQGNNEETEGEEKTDGGREVGRSYVKIEPLKRLREIVMGSKGSNPQPMWRARLLEKEVNSWGGKKNNARGRTYITARTEGLEGKNTSFSNSEGHKGVVLGDAEISYGKCTAGGQKRTSFHFQLAGTLSYGLRGRSFRCEKTRKREG